LSNRIVLRGTFNEHEVQPYPHRALSRLLTPFADPQEKEGEEQQEELSGEEQSERKEQQHEATPAPSVDEILVAAQDQAEAILASVQAEVEQVRQEAYAQGLLSGREEGREQAKQELLSSLVVFAQAGQSLIVLEEQLVARFTPQLVRFALEIAEKIVGKQVEEDPLIVATVLERARAELPQARTIRIWLHPQDHQILTELRPDLVWVGEKGGRTVEVLSSEEIERGGCQVETEMGVVDATIPVQMQEIRRQLLDEETF
jgi:flagellar assembly protein FliH